MNNPTWPKVFAFVGLALFGIVLAYYSTAVSTGGITARILGSDPRADALTNGSAVLLTGVAVAAVFAFIAIIQARRLMRGG